MQFSVQFSKCNWFLLSAAEVNALNSLLFLLIDIMVQITVLIIGLPNGFYIICVAGVVN